MPPGTIIDGNFNQKKERQVHPMIFIIEKVVKSLLTQATNLCFFYQLNLIFILKKIVYHHLLNLQSKTENRGSPNNNDYYIPEGYERHAHIGNTPLLFSSG